MKFYSRSLLVLKILFLLLGGLTACRLNDAGSSPISGSGLPFTVVESSISEMQRAMEEGIVDSENLVLESLSRIAMYEDRLNAAISINPQALEEARIRDRERASGLVRSLLHGVPIALKDNIHTMDLPTTGGALAFDGFIPPYEATITKNLRDAGAIILAKSGMTELANWVAGPPNPMPGGYNALTGYGMNPYDPRRDPRQKTADGRPVLSVSGSSSGIGTAASFWIANVGTETSGSILSPANRNMLVAIKPTVGRISRYGIIPITTDQDTAGPMARTVSDAAILLGVLEGTKPDLNDVAAGRCEPPPEADYTAFLKRDGLKGARIGIPRPFFYEKILLPGCQLPLGGLNPNKARMMTEALSILEQEGAIVVDPAPIPSIVSQKLDQNFLFWPICSGVDDSRGKDFNCSIVLKYGMKRDFTLWLKSLDERAPFNSLTELRQWNLAHVIGGSIKYGQGRLDISDEIDLDADHSRYLADRAKDLKLTANQGINAVIQKHNLDALLFPGVSGSSLAARPGYPSVTVPFGNVPNEVTPPFPEGFEASPSPFGISFTGMSCSEPRLVEIAYAFEQATRRRVPPPMSSNSDCTREVRE